MKNFFAAVFIRVMGILPLSVLRIGGHLVGGYLYFVNGRYRKVSSINLRIAFPHLSEEDHNALVRNSLNETAKTAFEACAIWCKSAEWLSRHMVSFEGDDLLRSQLGAGKGVLVLAPHHGNWEVVAPFLASRGPLTAMYQPVSLKSVDKIVLNGRSKLNISMAPTTKKGVMMLLKALNRGEIVGILPDQVPSKSAGGDVASFFNYPALTMTLVDGLVKRTGCAVCTCYAERVDGGFKLVVMSADERIYHEDVKTALDGLNASVEACILRAPDQYQWEYKRFKKHCKILKNPYCTKVANHS
jgi:KDO2-lipid IV(A) lauroyltransferase